MKVKDIVKYFYTQHSNHFSNLTTTIQKKEDGGVWPKSALSLPHYVVLRLEG